MPPAVPEGPAPAVPEGPAVDALPPEAFAVSLAAVPGIGPRTLRRLIEVDATPRVAWEALVGGRVSLPARHAANAVGHARRTDVASLWAAHVREGVGVGLLGRAGYPRVLADDPEAPAVLFSVGSPTVLDAAPRVAVIGTRSATRYGLGVAAQLGADLAAAGVVVVSGLALGIDGAAHEGAVAAWRAACDDASSAPCVAPDATTRARPCVAPPVGVVAGSVSAPYPRQHAGLWRRVAAAGAVLSESPIGTTDLAWRFPLRNRIIAAVVDVVVVVECHSRGGSLHTVQAATARGVPVGAVPGSVRSPASAGTNALLADGCFVVRDTSDVLVAVGLATATASTGPSWETATRAGIGELPSPTSDVLAAVGWDQTTLDEVIERTKLPMDAACAVLERLRARGLVHGEAGSWTRA